MHLPHTILALEYLAIVQSLHTPTPLSAVKGHLFKLLRPALARETDLRERLGRVRAVEKERALREYVEIVQELQERMERDMREAEEKIGGKEGRWEELVGTDVVTGIKVLPHWLAQPYFRPLQVLAPKKPKEPKTKVDVKVNTMTEGGVELDETIAVKRDRTPEELDASKRVRVMEVDTPTVPTMLAA